MAHMNKVLLLGNLTRDVELRHTPAGMAVASFGLAVNRKWRDRQGEQKEETVFVDCDAWDKTAETAAKYLAKGSQVLVEGRLKLDQWEDKETQAKRSKLKVVADSIQFLKTKRDEQGAPAGGAVEPKPAVDEDAPF